MLVRPRGEAPSSPAPCSLRCDRYPIPLPPLRAAGASLRLSSVVVVVVAVAVVAVGGGGGGRCRAFACSDACERTTRFSSRSFPQLCPLPSPPQLPQLPFSSYMDSETAT
jgi:hypothetical protein